MEVHVSRQYQQLLYQCQTLAYHCQAEWAILQTHAHLDGCTCSVLVGVVWIMGKEVIFLGRYLTLLMVGLEGRTCLKSPPRITSNARLTSCDILQALVNCIECMWQNHFGSSIEVPVLSRNFVHTQTDRQTDRTPDYSNPPLRQLGRELIINKL